MTSKAPEVKPLGQAPGREIWPVRARRVLEDLGPTFIKLGQLLASRPDLVPKEVAGEFSKLLDEVPGFGLQQVRSQCISQLGALPEEIFAFFDYSPLASASIAQVHRAWLKSGHPVAVKIQRPGLRRVIEKDLSILRALESRLAHSPLGRVCNVPEIIHVYSRLIRRELDFTAEGLSMESFREIFAPYPEIVVPRVYWQYSGQEILTMDFIQGNTISAEELESGDSQRRKALARNLLRAVLIPFFKTGVFHADPHPGNVLFLPDQRLGLIDFGIVGRLDEDFRHQVAQLMLALEEGNVSEVVNITLILGLVEQKINRADLYQDIAEVMEKATSMNNGGINMGHLINGMVDISLGHGIKMPGSFFALGKAIVNAEGMAQRLDPSLNILEVARPLALEYLRERLQPNLSSMKLYQKSNSLLKTATKIPGHLAQVLENLAEGELKTVFVHRGLETFYSMLDVASTRLSLSLIIGSLMGGSALILHAELGPKIAGLSLVGLSGFMIAFGLGVWMVIGMIRHGRLK